ncbi:hypothetical protein [Mycobacterium sp. Aquia_213]|uniref:hypothetical protein n=1 Tax=Mycobacterium sp. Aquia_213 TaxID=2991728 RepID=UPI00226FA0D0|nr:hypothetical protein [Mycobacterium sp. Aquia_213]WAC89570.1 hypothetical protein LMQ14_16530 [Mycobacterium sp. Aquia_213]
MGTDISLAMNSDAESLLTTAVSSSLPVRPARGVRSGRIVRSNYLRSKSLQSAQRSELMDQLYAIFSDTLYGCTRDELEEVMFSAGDIDLILCYGVHDELVGFSFAGIEHIEHAGRTFAVFTAGGFFRPGYHGGVRSILFGLGQATRAKLRNPRIPVGYLTRCTTPAVYRLLASKMPRVYPNRRYPTPTDIEELVQAISAGRHYTVMGENPWVVGSIGKMHHPSRLRRLEYDPEVRFYTELNPRFAEGEALLAWTPLDVANIAGGFARALRARLDR